MARNNRPWATHFADLPYSGITTAALVADIC
jgi:hypothetical protein